MVCTYQMAKNENSNTITTFNKNLYFSLIKAAKPYNIAFYTIQ